MSLDRLHERVSHIQRDIQRMEKELGQQEGRSSELSAQLGSLTVKISETLAASLRAQEDCRDARDDMRSRAATQPIHPTGPHDEVLTGRHMTKQAAVTGAAGIGIGGMLYAILEAILTRLL